MFIKLIALTLPLCLDSFLLAAAIGLSGPSGQHRLRLSSLFAVFEAGMPLIGLLIGRGLSGTLGAAAQYVAVAILIGFGGYSAIRTKAEDTEAQRFGDAHGLMIIAIGLGISLDGLAIGFTYGLLKLPVVLVTILIAFQAFVLSQLGFRLGTLVPERWRQYGERLASLALVAIGLVLLAQQLQR